MDADQISRDLLFRIRGHQIAAMIHVAARLSLPDRVGEGLRLEQLAREAGVRPSTLRRLIRALSAFQIFHIDEADHVSQTPSSRLLMTETPGSLHAAAAFWGLPCGWDSWGQLEYAIRTGESAFDHVFDRTFFEYLESNRDARRAFDLFMAGSPEDRHVAAVSAYDFARFRSIVDVGGGDGMLIAHILASSPHASGILFDRPEVVATPSPRLRPFLEQGRCKVVGGSFFDTIPAGCDACVLSQIIHDWEDAPALRILAGCRAGLARGATLLVIERLLDPSMAEATANNLLSDIEMLVVTHAAERTPSEYEALFAEAGFRLKKVIPTSSPFAVFECLAV